MQENKTLGSAINQINNCNTTEEYLNIKFIPEDICDNFVLPKCIKNTVIDIISIIILTIYLWKGNSFYDNVNSDDDGSVILLNMLDQSSVLRLLKDKLSKIDIYDQIIYFLDIHSIAYTIQNPLESYKNCIIIDVGEGYTLILCIIYDRDSNVINKIKDIYLEKIEYISYIKQQITHSSHFKIYPGDSLSNKGILI